MGIIEKNKYSLWLRQSSRLPGAVRQAVSRSGCASWRTCYSLRVQAEDTPCATVRADQVEHAADGDGLPGTFRTRKADNLAALDFQVRTAQSMKSAVNPSEDLGLDCSFLDTTPYNMIRSETDPRK